MSREPDADIPDGPRAARARDAWLEFRRTFEGERPDLYRFCRRLTRTPWDAEDLVQEALMRAFVVSGSQYGHAIENPRAWLFRVATNAWIDRTRRTSEPSIEPTYQAGVAGRDVQSERESAGTLIARLSPQERVAVVLKDAFDLSLEEIAAALGTTTGAVKSALHRARGKLTDDEPPRVAKPLPSAITAFCRAFDEGDLDAVIATLLDSATIEVPGVAIDHGVVASLDPDSGILRHSLLEPLSSGVPDRFLEDYLPDPPYAEIREHLGEALVLIGYRHRGGGSAIRCFVRFDIDAESGLIANVRQYYYSPEALAEVADGLGLPHRVNGYGF